MKWASGRDGSIEIETDDGVELSFKDLDALDAFSDQLCDVRNEIAEAIEEQGSDEQQGPSRT